MSNHAVIAVGTRGEHDAEYLHPDEALPLIERVMPEDQALAMAGVFATLADATRARLLHLLSLAEELCVGDLALLVGLSQSAVSHQLRLLRDRRVVSRRKVGRIVYYRLADEHVRHVLADGLKHAMESVSGTSERVPV